LNVQSFMGAIMAIGVAVANAILLVTFAEQSRRIDLAKCCAISSGQRAHLACDQALARNHIPEL